MLVLITYDVCTIESTGRRRLRRVAQACKDYGVRVQKSVFECKVSQKDWLLLRARLLEEMKVSEDSVRFYFIDEDNAMRTEHHGALKPTDLTEPLIP